MKRLADLVVCVVLAASTQAFSFSFSEEEAKTQAEQDARSERAYQKLSVGCRDGLKNKKIMVVIGQRFSNGIQADQTKYSPIFDAINQRLRFLGLKTYTQAEIRKQIAQAEIDAYMRNDPDAAMAASKRLGASFILRGLISTQTGVNPTLGINEVAVQMGFTLTASSGKTISQAGAKSESYAGTDTLAMALTLVNEQADEVVADLYYDYCTQAEAGTRKK
jgi:hypothetical protein